MSRSILFPGTFNPFTVGHQSLVDRILPLFDHVIIAVGTNSGKQTAATTTDQRIDTIRRLYADNPKITVTAYDGLTVDACHHHNARWILRGVRTTIDFEYERNLADINRHISGIETIILFTLPQHTAISSTIVRELQHYGRDVGEYLPVPPANDK